MEEKEREEIFIKLLTEYQGKIFNLVFWRIGDYEEAQDLTQEIFLKVYNALPKFRGEASPYTWLYRIALNHTTKHLRRKRVFRFISLEKFPEDDFPVDPPQERESTPLQKLIREKVSHLSPVYRDVIVLFYFDNKTLAEISKLLNISIGTVKSRLARGRETLSKWLSDFR